MAATVDANLVLGAVKAQRNAALDDVAMLHARVRELEAQLRAAQEKLAAAEAAAADKSKKRK